MARIMGLVLAGGLILGMSSAANAQVAISVGNPYVGRGLYVGSGYGYPAYAAPAYVAPPVVPYAYPAYPAYPAVGLGIGFGGIGYPAYRPYYGGGYGYRPYGGGYYHHGGYRRY